MGKNFDFWFLLLYAIAAISGAMGGCASALYHLSHGGKQAFYAFAAAYAFMGLVFGVITIAVLVMYGEGPKDIHELILFSFIGGGGGSIALLSTNWTVRAVLRKFGLDVQLTIRPESEERRSNDEHQQQGN